MLKAPFIVSSFILHFTFRMKRPPIIVVVGSVDHGKTTLLDYIRNTNVAAREAGGITQSVGAYEIEHQTSDLQSPTSRKITFIDTPGHEAFTRMRRRGAHLADLGILVVAADDSVQPQTRESIKILTETKTPFVVAINKVDRVGEREIKKVQDDLADAGVLLEGKGGSVSFHEISAKTGDGVNDLLDLVLLATDVEHLEYDPAAPGRGVILEATRTAGRGIIATAVLHDGTLRKGDSIRAGTATGKVKILEDFLGKEADALTASSPARIVGFDALPQIGDEMTSGAAAQFIASAAEPTIPTAAAIKTEAGKDACRVLLKADVAGSLEALAEVMKNLAPPVAIVAQSVGDVTDGDVRLASATGAAIIAFRVRVTRPAETLSRAHRVRIIASAVIYELIQAVKEAMEGETDKAARGSMEVRALFGKKDGRQIVGGAVTEGALQNQATLRITRGGKIIGDARVVNLQARKKDAPRVEATSDCGLLVESTVEIKVGDTLVASGS